MQRMRRGQQIFAKALKAHAFHNLKQAARNKAKNARRRLRIHYSKTSSDSTTYPSNTDSDPTTLDNLLDGSRPISSASIGVGETATISTAKSPRRRVRRRISRRKDVDRMLPNEIVPQSSVTPSWLQVETFACQNSNLEGRMDPTLSGNSQHGF